MRRWLSILILAGCADAAPEAPPEKKKPKANEQQVYRKLPPLRGTATLPMFPAGLEPPGYADARETFRTATTAYARGDAETAAEHFLDTARQLEAPADPRTGRTLAAGRCIAYECAGRAWSANRDYAEAKERLLAIRNVDAACRHSISAILARVHQAHLDHGPQPRWRHRL